MGLNIHEVGAGFIIHQSDVTILFINQMLQYLSRCGKPMFATWREFRQKFTEEFCLKNEVQMALTKLETSAYYQSQKSMDEYIDEFRDLIDQAGYSEGLAIVMKFWHGLQWNIQDLIAQLPIGCLADDKLEDWYAAAL